jgi:hypothetical protein
MKWIGQLKQFIASLVRTDQPESPQLAVVLLASLALILSLAAVVLSCANAIMKTGDLGTGALGALTAATAGLTALAIHSNKVQQ